MFARIFADRFVLLLLATILLASFIPVRGHAAEVASLISSAAIFLLFFLNGVRLPRHEVVNGVRNWGKGYFGINDRGHVVVHPGKTPDQVEAGLIKIIPPDYLFHAHHWLILHGRYVCQARKPLCWQCGVSEFCSFKPKTTKP